MKPIQTAFALLITLSVLNSCKEEPVALSEDFYAVSFVSRGDDLYLRKNQYLETEKIHFVLFIYHDTIFQVDLQEKKPRYSYLKCKPAVLDSLKSMFAVYEKTNLSKQLKDLKENGPKLSCIRDEYFLFRKGDQINFGIFDFMDYYDWYGRRATKEVKLKKYQFPQIYQTIYFGLNSRRWDYVMSNRYYYKEFRIRDFTYIPVK
ncbi:hypothetical protein [Fluviicola sp.]|uniref:hypothetical protein n=1 Tax=Fluviicola sp. TaxID=1917219 RepID=UPI0031D57420